MNNSVRAHRLALIGVIVSAVVLVLALLQASLASAAPTAAGVIIQPGAASQKGAPGATITYTLRMTNTGTGADTFDLELLGHLWPTTYTVTGVGQTVFLALASGAGQEIKVTVTIPLTATGSDVTGFRVTSQADAGVSATSTLTTTVDYRLYVPLAHKP